MYIFSLIDCFYIYRYLRVDLAAQRTKVTLPNLPYDYQDLEPIISRDIMHLHHQKHHAAYVNNYNIAEEKLQDAVAKGKKDT